MRFIKKHDDGSSADVKIALNKRENFEGDEGGDDLTVLGVLGECLEAEGRFDHIRARAARNERFIYGDQGSDYDRTRQEYYNLDAQGEYSPRNLLRNLWAQTSARMLEDKTNVRAYPTNSNVRSVAASEVANQLIKFYTSENDLDDEDFTAMGLAQNAGCAGFRVHWDPTRGPPSDGFPETEMRPAIDIADDGAQVETEQEVEVFNEDGTPSMLGVGEPQGDISIATVSIHDFVTDGSPDEEDSDWVVFRSCVSPHIARRMLKMASISKEPATQDKGEDGRTTRVDSNESALGAESVLVQELYWRPSARFAKGVYALVVGGHVVDASDYPYDHGELPLCLFQWNPRKGAIAPKTHVDDAIPEQKTINYILGAIDRLTIETGKIKRHLPKSVEDQEGDVIYLNDPSDAQAIGWEQPPDVPALFASQLEEKRAALYEVFGTSEQLTGASRVGSSTAARTIAYQSALYAQKFAGPMRSFGKCKRRLWRQVLSLVQQFVEDERTIAIVGDDDFIETIHFSGAEIDGSDIRLEVSSGQSSAADAAQAEADTMAGLEDPASGVERRETGLPETSGEADTQRQVTAQVARVAAGEPPQPIPGVDPLIAAQTVRDAIAHYDKSDVLTQLLAAYEMAGAQQANPQQVQTTDAQMGNPDAQTQGLVMGVPQ